MKLLKNQQEFEEYVLYSGLNNSKPEQYPCYILHMALNSIYLYRHDIEKMLMSLLPHNATVKISKL